MRPGFFNAEFFVPLKTRERLAEGSRQGDADQRTVFHASTSNSPAIEFNFSQYIQDNVEEAVSGVKGENSIKLFGNDLQALTKTANEIKAIMKTVPGVTDLAVFSSVGSADHPPSTSNVSPPAVYGSRAGRHQLRGADRGSAAQAAGDSYEEGSDRHFPIVVRLAQPLSAQHGGDRQAHDRRDECGN